MTNDIEELRRAISYDPETGALTWRPRGGSGKEVKRWNSRYAGKPAFNSVASSGHLTGTMGKKHMKAHRAAWAIYYGFWPKNEVDHANGEPADNRLSNLRDATRTQNAQNLGRRKGGRSVYRGVSRDGNKWKAMINANGVRTYLGVFESEEMAAMAYDLAAPIMHGEFARPNIVNDREAITAFIEDYAKRNHRDKAFAADGLRAWQEKVAV